MQPLATHLVSGPSPIENQDAVVVSSQKAKPISYKIRSVSKEITGMDLCSTMLCNFINLLTLLSGGKAVNIIDPDQRFAWNTGSNQKEQIVLEL